MVMTIVKFIHIMSLVVWIGGIIFFSFFAAPSIFKVLDRELAGDVVGNIFPKYWLIGYICSPIALGTLIFLAKYSTASVGIRIVLLSVMLITVFFTGLAIGSKAKKIKAEMRATEDVVKKEEIRKHFGKIHGISIMLNMAVLLMGIATIFITAYYIKI